MDDEIIVVTLLLVTRGALQVPSTVQAWPDVRQTLQQVRGGGACCRRPGCSAGSDLRGGTTGVHQQGV